MKTSLITLSLGAGLITWPALAQQAPLGYEASPPPVQTAQAQSQAPAQAPGMMGQGGQPGMMGRGMMQPGMMGAMPMMGMHGPMMKIMFAIADANGDGALSFDEVTALHKRIFDRIDANKDGKVTLEELQAFFQQ